MKLILSLTVLWAFASTAGALMCHVCTDVNDLDCAFGRSEECRSDEICFSAFIRETDGTQRIYRNCANPSVCPSTGPQIIAANLGGINTVANAACCDDDDDCNLRPLSFPAEPQENGIQCPGCDPMTDQCNTVVNCKGEENTCFQSPILKDRVRISVAGCGTPNVCPIAEEYRFLPFLEEVGTVLPTPMCFLFTTTTTTTTPEPTTTMTTTTTTTTTPEPTTTTTTTTTTPEPTTTTTTTTTTPEPTTTTPEPTTTTPEPTTPTTPHPTPSRAVLAKIKILLFQLQQLSAKINLALLQQQQVVLFQLHLKLLDDQGKLLAQQENLPTDHHQQLPLYYQQCLLVNNHQMLLHQIHLSLCREQNLLALFQSEQLVLHQLQDLLQSHHYQLLPHYAGHLQHHCDHSAQ